MKRSRFAAGAVALLEVAAGPAAAQVGPSGGEVIGYTGLLLAAARGDLEQVRRAIAGRAPLEERDGYGRTPLIVATFGGRGEIVEALARAGADLGAKDRDGYDALTIAAAFGDAAMVRRLLARGASARQTTGRDGGSALAVAAHRGRVDALRALIAGGAPLDRRNVRGWTPLLEAVAFSHGDAAHVACVRALLAAGANPKLADREGLTPLALARGRGYAKMVEALEPAGKR